MSQLKIKERAARELTVLETRVFSVWESPMNSEEADSYSQVKCAPPSGVGNGLDGFRLADSLVPTA